MASEAACDEALLGLVAMLDAVDPDLRAKYVMDRTVSCRVSDLGCSWSARVCDEGLVDLKQVEADDSRAQVRLTVTSDDLLALIEGRLTVPMAVATGRLRVQANPLDLLRLGALL